MGAGRIELEIRLAKGADTNAVKTTLEGMAGQDIHVHVRKGREHSFLIVNTSPQVYTRIFGEELVQVTGTYDEAKCVQHAGSWQATQSPTIPNELASYIEQVTVLAPVSTAGVSLGNELDGLG